jgi:alpha-glucoside transport system permease protein
MSLVPLLRVYQATGLTGSFIGIWLAHTGFGLPLAIYLLFNYISQLPRDIFESAYVDGATPFTAFTRLVLPLSFPALASFAIFQFLWVWNDLLVSLVYLGTSSDVAVLTVKLASLVGTRGEAWHLLTAAGFVSMIIPLVVFLALQRFFVRGLLAGSVKG